MSFSGGFVEILAAQQTLDSSDWYQGTADAVRQNIRYLQQADIDHVLVLSGDQLYRMNYADMLATHDDSGADVTIAAMPVTRAAASGFGIMRSDDTGRVVGFLEKPKTAAEMDSMRTDPAWIDARGVASRGRDLLASMGIYLFNRDMLVDVLDQDRLPRFRPRGVSRFDPSPQGADAPVRRLLGRHRHDQVVLPVQSRSGGEPSAVRLGVGRSADLHAGPLLAPVAHRRRDDQQ